MIYRADILERWLVPVTVEADNPEQARQLISERQGEHSERIFASWEITELREAGEHE